MKMAVDAHVSLDSSLLAPDHRPAQAVLRGSGRNCMVGRFSWGEIMKVGIIGLPGAGKSTLFNALTKGNAETGRFGPGRSQINRGRTEVPDPRLDWLAALYSPKKKTHAAVDFLDVPGAAPGSLEKDASALISDLRTADALLHVVRVFEDPAVAHFRETVDPVRDASDLEAELILSDLQVVEKRLARIEMDLKKGVSRAPLTEEKGLLEPLKSALEEGRPVRSISLSDGEESRLRGYSLLSQKPQILVGNRGENEEEKSAAGTALAAFAKEARLPYLSVAGRIESEIAQMSDEDAAAFLADLGISEPSRDRVIRAAFDVLSLISFFTFGEDECKAWTVRKGSNAVEAAAKIHSDIARGFIRAEVVSFDHFRAAGTWAGTRESGHFRLEGREYVMQDGDCVIFRFNV
jgi:GTP-binding protein YchF